MTTAPPVLAPERIAARLAALADAQQVSTKRAAEIAAEIGLTSLNIQWWRKQCDEGLPCVRLRRDRFIALKIVLDVIERVIERAKVSEVERERMVEQAARRGARFVNHKLKCAA